MRRRTTARVTMHRRARMVQARAPPSSVIAVAMSPPVDMETAGSTPEDESSAGTDCVTLDAA
jgi:hypothetical protein